MKKIGFPLDEIKERMKSYTTANSLIFLKQLEVLESKIQELSLIKNRLSHRCEQIETALSKKNTQPELGIQEECYILYCNVDKPYSMRDISIATKKCYAQALTDSLPVFFEYGVSVPLKHILSVRCTEAVMAFLTSDNTDVENIIRLPRGLAISTYHFGNYRSISSAYQRLLDFSRENLLGIISDSYEFCVNDYITSRYEDEFITKIVFYVKSKI